MSIITTASTIANLLGNDGTLWCDPIGRTIDELAAEYDPMVEHDTANDLHRMAFADGSALVISAGGWDIEGSTPFSFAGDEHPERDDDFYRDAFTTESTWGKDMWAEELESHGIVADEDESFAATAERLWNAYSEEERAEFASNYDDWLDA